MKKLILLDNQYNANTNDIWKSAIKNGWNTQRTTSAFVKKDMEGYGFIRYYGNFLHADRIKDELPFIFDPIPPEILANSYQFTKRDIKLLKFKDLKQPFDEDIFVKPCGIKWFEARIYKKGESINAETIKPDDLIYTSEIVEFRNEVRCFVLNGEVLTSSLYRINGEVYDTLDLEPEDINFDNRIDETPIRQYVKEIVEKNPLLPIGLVIDFWQLENGDWALIEFNEAWCSGLYWCDPNKCLDVIINSVIDIKDNNVEVDDYFDLKNKYSNTCFTR